ncbi:hypothetical protein GJ744_002859 [Endocarpon pusillum]|uniref:Uncharacterized protein n=1 Tax=Endocarpon pusillum TaxID=364733 RepID=A0A8H7AAS5_9EURO|nr:hypothetical protein GJ744_002859 [Endocarpon pusillum]
MCPTESCHPHCPRQARRSGLAVVIGVDEARFGSSVAMVVKGSNGCQEDAHQRCAGSAAGSEKKRYIPDGKAWRWV